MKLNSSKAVFIFMILISCLVSLSANNWMSIWIMMELALFMFIPLISKNKINDQSIKYFIIQNTSSYLLVFSILCNSINFNPFSNLLTMVSLMLKIGMPPFHIWKPEIMSKMPWKECILLTTLIKIPPMILINKLVTFKMFILPLILSLAVGSIAGINQLNLKKMMAYSSIFNLTWMSASFMINKKIMLMFLLLYSSLNIKTMLLFKMNNLNYLSQVINMPLKMKMIMNLNLLSISGLPPLTGFFPKWVILTEMAKTSIILPSMMVACSVVSIFMYIQMNTFSFSNLMVKKKNYKIRLTKTLTALNLLVLHVMFIIWSN